MQRLQVLGHWFLDEAPSALPRPQALVAPWDPDALAAVVRHLRAGFVLVRFPEASHCRFHCGEEAMGHADLTDGTYVWPEGLVHYVERHSVRLPDPFVAHALAHPQGVPAFALPKPAFGLYDLGPWQRWARQQGACLDLDGFEIPTGDVLDRVANDLGDVPHEAILLCCGATRQVVLAVGGGALEVRQLRAGGHAPVRFAGWHEWSRDRLGAGAVSPGKPGRGESMGDFFAKLRRRHGLDGNC
jgi:hypothetical protein